MAIVPTWRLGVVLAVGAVPIMFSPDAAAWVVLGLVDALAVLAVVVDAVRAPGPRRFEVTRALPGVIALDGAATLTWEVRGGRGRDAWVHLADALPPSLRADDRRARLRVPAQGTARAQVALRPSRRGRFTLDEVTLRVEGPWRLMARQRRLPVTDELRVHPAFRSRRVAELRIERALSAEAGLRTVRAHGGGTEFEQLREYTVDDEFRRMDWAATARTGKPIVRTYRTEQNQHVMTLLDTGRLMAARLRDPEAEGQGWGEVPRLDHAMDAAMTLTRVATGLGDRAGLIAFSDRVHAVVPLANARDQLGRVTEAICDLDPQLVESDYRGAFVASLARSRRRALLVVLTELSPEALEETLVPALPLVLRSHLVLIAGVRDPEVDRWARRAPTDAGEAYRKAAAVAALDARGRITARLRGMGAQVIDEPPGRLAPRLADAYLDVKATNRL